MQDRQIPSLISDQKFQTTASSVIVHNITTLDKAVIGLTAHDEYEVNNVQDIIDGVKRCARVENDTSLGAFVFDLQNRFGAFRCSTVHILGFRACHMVAIKSRVLLTDARSLRNNGLFINVVGPWSADVVFLISRQLCRWQYEKHGPN